MRIAGNLYKKRQWQCSLSIIVYTCACSTMQVHWQGHSGREGAASTSRPQDTGPCSGAGLLCAVGPSPPWEGREDLSKICYTKPLLPPPLRLWDTAVGVVNGHILTPNSYRVEAHTVRELLDSVLSTETTEDYL